MRVYELALKDFSELLEYNISTTGGTRLQEESRIRVQRALESMLLEQEVLEAHLSWLASHLQINTRPRFLSAEEQEAVVNRGIGTISDESLAALALNPYGLRWLAAEINEALLCSAGDFNPPEVWIEAGIRLGKEEYGTEFKRRKP